MKNFLNSCCCLAVCAAMLVQPTFASDTDSQDTIYVEDPQQVMSEVNTGDGNVTRALEAFSVYIDENTIMPLYQASLLDFARSGELSISLMEMGGGQIYFADVKDNSDKFAGVVQFTTTGEYPDVHMMMPSTDKNRSIDFKANANRVTALMKQKTFDVAAYEAKMMWVEGLGYVYYVDNSTEVILIAAGLKGTNGDIFTEETNGIVVLNDALREQAQLLVDRQAEQDAYLDTLPPGENPETGGSVPAFIVDNAKYNSNRYILPISFIGIVVITAAIAIFKKKDSVSF